MIQPADAIISPAMPTVISQPKACRNLPRILARRARLTHCSDRSRVVGRKSSSLSDVSPCKTALATMRALPTGSAAVPPLGTGCGRAGDARFLPESGRAARFGSAGWCPMTRASSATSRSSGLIAGDASESDRADLDRGEASVPRLRTFARSGMDRPRRAAGQAPRKTRASRWSTHCTLPPAPKPPQPGCSNFCLERTLDNRLA